MNLPSVMAMRNARADDAEQAASCHTAPQPDTRGLPLIAIVGCPNVGKSVLFNTLTGAYAVVSNYPGTTVEVTRGRGRLQGFAAAIVDTPGMYRMLPITEEERVARQILLRERPAAVIHVVDAKNLDRMLPMTLQLLEAGLPVLLDVNLLDEAEARGIAVDVAALESALGTPVAGTALASGRGAEALKQRIAAFAAGTPAPAAHPAINYHPAIEAAVAAIVPELRGTYALTPRAVALLLLQNDAEVATIVREQEGDRTDAILHSAAGAQARFSQPLAFVIAREQRDAAQHILRHALSAPTRRPQHFAERLSAAMIRPITGVPILLVALALLHQFVGVFGAQTLVELLEDGLFGAYVNPWVEQTLAALIPWQALRDLFGGPYGVITLGVRYAVALILPIVGTFFIAFSLVEDSGYLPRLALLVDRAFKHTGLNGRAVIPLVLGFGCDTMATIVTRTLETRRERILGTLLLALAIPCSAQLGVMLGMLGGRPLVLALWILVVAGVFLLVGFLAARLVPGDRPSFYMELPPLRLPTPRNVLVKTYTRMEWYFREVFPVFIGASVVLWAGHLTGAFDLAGSAASRSILPQPR